MKNRKSVVCLISCVESCNIIFGATMHVFCYLLGEQMDLAVVVSRVKRLHPGCRRERMCVDSDLGIYTFGRDTTSTHYSLGSPGLRENYNLALPVRFELDR